MYTIKFFAPMILMACANDIVNQRSSYYVCNLNQSQPPVVRYYESGKSCYRNGIFYKDCAEGDV